MVPPPTFREMVASSRSPASPMPTDPSTADGAGDDPCGDDSGCAGLPAATLLGAGGGLGGTLVGVARAGGDSAGAELGLSLGLSDQAQLAPSVHCPVNQFHSCAPQWCCARQAAYSGSVQVAEAASDTGGETCGGMYVLWPPGSINTEPTVSPRMSLEPNVMLAGDCDSALGAMRALAAGVSGFPDDATLATSEASASLATAPRNTEVAGEAAPT